MTKLFSELIPFLTLIDREVKRFMKVLIQTVVSPVISNCLYLIVFGVSLGSTVQLKSGVSYLVFLVPGLMVMGLINNAFQNSTSSIVTSKFSGDLEDLRVSPVSQNQIIWAMGVGAVIRGSFVALISGLVGAIFIYNQTGTIFVPEHPFWFLFYTISGGLMFGFCGIMVGFFAKTFDDVSAFTTFILLPLTYLGGVFISIETLHPVFQTISHLNPLFYLINGFRYSMIGISDVAGLVSAVVVFFFVILTYGLATWSLKRGSFQRW